MQNQNALPDASSRRSEKDEERFMVRAVVQLLVYAWKRTSVHPGFQNSVMASIKTIRRFLASSTTVSIDSLVFQVPLAAMPILLCDRMDVTVVKSMALLGDIALHSFKSTMLIVSERKILQILLSHLNSPYTHIQKEACHIVACIASSRQGQRGLCDLEAVQKLMRLLLLVTGFLTNTVHQREVKKSLELSSEPFISRLTDISLLSGVLEALDSLLGHGNFDGLRSISQGAGDFILKALQVIWKSFRKSFKPPIHSDHIRVVAKIIVWILMEHGDVNEGLNPDARNVDKILFGGGGLEVEHFCNEHWEQWPFLMIENVNGCHARCKILKTWHFEGGSRFPRELLTTTLACPAFSCDELEMSQIYREIENELGKSLVLGQDIRLVKSVCIAGCMMPCSEHTVLEKDYHHVDQGLTVETHGNINSIAADANMCHIAYDLGYTIALRGLEFRCSYIAEIAEELAVFFGQATVGANLYITPPNEQGFKPHYDDHCVLVWQLSGCKFWKLWCPEFFLPRLYSQDTTVERICKDEESIYELFLREGNILYIPRGFLHAATTQVNSEMSGRLWCTCLECTQEGSDICTEKGPCIDDPESLVSTNNEGCLKRKQCRESCLDTCISRSRNCSKKLKVSAQSDAWKTVHSVHITFGVEVEPPFDWEGFAHISLHCWASKQEWIMFDKSSSGESACDSSARKLGDLYKGLMHVAIRLCGERCSAFRKACLIAAQSRHCEACSTTKFESFFKELLQEVANLAAFKDVLHMVLTAIDTPEAASLDWMHWLRHLLDKHEPSVWSDPVAFFHERLRNKMTSNESLEQMEAKFTVTKKCFVSGASYADTCDAFVGLLSKYRQVRKKYTASMLALHV